MKRRDVLVGMLAGGSFSLTEACSRAARVQVPARCQASGGRALTHVRERCASSGSGLRWTRVHVTQTCASAIAAPRCCARARRGSCPSTTTTVEVLASSACRARTGDHRRRHLGLDERAASIERRPLAAGIDAALDGELQAQPDRTPTDGREQQQAEGQCGSSPPGARLVFRQAGFTISSRARADGSMLLHSLHSQSAPILARIRPWLASAHGSHLCLGPTLNGTWQLKLIGKALSPACGAARRAARVRLAECAGPAGWAVLQTKLF
jgi:hypothetical protein